MVVINMHIVNAIMFLLVCSTGKIGMLLLWACVWFPIAASIKMEYEIINVSRYLTQGKVQTIAVEDGGTIKVAATDSSSADLTVGMSMGEP